MCVTYFQGFDNASFPAKTSRGSNVILDAKILPTNAAQTWSRTLPDEHDWFKLTNSKFGYLLAAANSNKATFEGTYFLTSIPKSAK